MLVLSHIVKRYGTRVAVDDLSLEVRPGEILGLLGPNGAGKSTTMHVATGLLRPDAGTVAIGAYGSPASPDARRRLGLAPQSLAVYDLLTAEENLAFFGQLYGLSGAVLKQRVDAALAFVGLGDRRRDRVHTYSGGMKRRLNIAAAVLHEPELVLLDEPTVGVDPQSRNAIFDSIEALRTQGRTIVYSTHYMEEAVRLCDRVAIIDAGRVLALDTVPALIRAHGGTPTLHVRLPGREVVLQTHDPLAELNRLSIEAPVESFRVDEPTLEQVFLAHRAHAARLRPTDMSAMLAIAIKDLRTFSRQRASLFFTFIWPVCVAVLFGVLFGGSNKPTPRLPIAVVDEDQTPASKAFADRLVARDTFEATRATRADALEAVRKGQRTAAVVLRPGFGEASSRMFYGTPPEVQVYTDPSRQAERGMLEGLLMQQGAERMQTMFSDPAAGRQNVQKTLDDLKKSDGKADPGLETFLGQLDTFLATPGAAQLAPGAGGAAGEAWSPLRITQEDLQRQRTGPRNGYDLTFPQAMLWAVFGCVMAFGTTFASERVRGTIVRLHVSPLSKGQVLAGKSLAALLAICLVECLLMLLGVTVFGVRASSWPLLLLAITCTAAAFVGIILLLASMAHTEQGIGGMAPAVMMPLFLLGGAMVPLMFMPPWMATLGYLSPVRWAIIALEGAIWRDFGVAEMAVPCAILLSIAVVTFVIGAKRQEAE